MEMISVANLYFSLAGKEIIKDVSFKLNSGEIFVLMVKNGAGKSVLLKIIAGLMPGFNREVKVKGILVEPGPGELNHSPEVNQP
jgi:ABC-type multidrug transport system ATPase subunit